MAVGLFDIAYVVRMIVSGGRVCRKSVIANLWVNVNINIFGQMQIGAPKMLTLLIGAPQNVNITDLVQPKMILLWTRSIMCRYFVIT